MNQGLLFAPKAPPAIEGIDLRCCDAAELLPMEGDLAIADPPWKYARRDGESAAQDHYIGLEIAEIVDHVRRIECPRMAVWITWPMLAGEWPLDLPGWGRPVTGGSWVKSMPGDTGHYGQGYHWSGCSEAVLIYTREAGHNSRALLRNAWVEEPGEHSVKPAQWMAQWIRRWCPPGGRVVEPYAGRGSGAMAVLEAGEGRTYLGAEIDEERHRGAMGLLAQWRGAP